MSSYATGHITAMMASITALRHCWLRKGIRPLKRTGWTPIVTINKPTLVCWWWQFDWSFARLIAPVVTTTSIILSSNRIQNGDILVPANPGPRGKWPLKRREREREIEIDDIDDNDDDGAEPLALPSLKWPILCRVRH